MVKIVLSNKVKVKLILLCNKVRVNIVIICNEVRVSTLLSIRLRKDDSRQNPSIFV